MEYFARLLLLICRLIGFLLTPILKLFYKKHLKLPVIEDDITCFTNESMDEVHVEKNLLLVAASDLVVDIKNGKV